MSTTFTLRMTEAQKNLIAEYARLEGRSMADFMLGSTLDAIEDAMLLQEWHEAKAEYEANPVSYTLEEVMEELGIE